MALLSHRFGGGGTTRKSERAHHTTSWSRPWRTDGGGTGKRAHVIWSGCWTWRPTAPRSPFTGVRAAEAPSGAGTPGRVNGAGTLALQRRGKAARPLQLFAPRHGPPRRTRFVGNARSRNDHGECVVPRHPRASRGRLPEHASEIQERYRSPRKHRASRRRQRQRGATDSTTEQGPEVRGHGTKPPAAQPLRGPREQGGRPRT
jgi:hypothetical protein